MLCFSGCSKEPEQAPPPNSPEVYMNDPEFRKQLADKRKELQVIVSERAPLVARMEELIQSNGQDVAVLEKIPEWNDLHKKVVELNAKYDEVRKQQLNIAHERLAPANKISK